MSGSRLPRWRRSSRRSGWWSGPLVATRAHSRSCDGACRTLSTLLLAAEKSSDLEVREAAMDVYLAAASVEKTEATAGAVAARLGRGQEPSLERLGAGRVAWTRGGERRGAAAEWLGGDALVTGDKGVALGILTADCAPILFHDKVAHVIGAAHAGWKGALHNIMESTLATMETLGARRGNITATIGPCISPKAYETGPEFIARFLAKDSDNSRFFAQGQGDRLLFDLPGFILEHLRRDGINKPVWTGHCTFSNPEKFFSYRRTSQAQEPDYGRQISVIAL